jgi:polysaccharide export outer membrane protein
MREKAFMAVLLIAAAGVIPALCQDQTQFAERNPKYRLHRGDVIDIEYTYTPEYNQTATVQPDGEVTLKLLGGVSVAGLTLDEAHRLIVERAGERLNKPEITLLLKDYVKPHFTVAGEVNKPGDYDIHGSVSAIEAIALSGGFKESSKQNQVVLVRKMNHDVAEVRLLNFKTLSSAAGIREDIEIKPDDILIVPKNRLSRVEPYVRIASMAMGGLYGVALFAK